MNALGAARWGGRLWWGGKLFWLLLLHTSVNDRSLTHSKTDASPTSRTELPVGWRRRLDADQSPRHSFKEGLKLIEASELVMTDPLLCVSTCEFFRTKRLFAEFSLVSDFFRSKKI